MEDLMNSIIGQEDDGNYSNSLLSVINNSTVPDTSCVANCSQSLVDMNSGINNTKDPLPTYSVEDITMEDVMNTLIGHDVSENYSNSLLSVINNTSVPDTSYVANCPESLGSSVNNTNVSESNYSAKKQLNTNNCNMALFVILSRSIICLICYKKFFRISSLRHHILWHLHRNSVPSNNLCRSCKCDKDILDCPCFKMIRKIMANFLLSTMKDRQPSLQNDSETSVKESDDRTIMGDVATGTSSNTNLCMNSNIPPSNITNSSLNSNILPSNTTNSCLNSNVLPSTTTTSSLDSNVPPTPFYSINVTEQSKQKDFLENSVQEDPYRLKDTSSPDETTNCKDSQATNSKNPIYPSLDSTEFLLVNGCYKCLTCSKDFIRNEFNCHVTWHFHKDIDLCSQLHFKSSTSGDMVCPLVVQIMNYLVSKEGNPIQVSWGKNRTEEIIFKVKLLKPETIYLADDSVSSSQSDTTSPSSNIIEILDLTCLSESDSDDNQEECSIIASLTYDKINDKSFSDNCHNNNQQLQCKERTGPNTIKKSCAVYSSDKSAEVWGFYKCMVTGCNYSTLFPVNYLKHLEMSHKNINSYCCSHCNFTAETCIEIVKHLKVHTIPRECLFPCGSRHCSYYTNVLSLLPKHFIDSHAGCKQILCKHCNIEFSNLDQLIEHYHWNFLKTVKCAFCPARDTQRQRILHHLASSHPGKARKIIVNCQLKCAAKKELGEYIKLPSGITVNHMKEIILPEYDLTAPCIEVSCLNCSTFDKNYSMFAQYINDLVNLTKSAKDLSGQLETLKECKDFHLVQGDNMCDTSNQSNSRNYSVKIKFSHSKDTSLIEVFDFNYESKSTNKKVYNVNSFSVNNFISLDVAGRELDACLRICYKLVDQAQQCKLCSQTKHSKQEIHCHLLQDHFHWYLWQCFKCKATTYSLEEMLWHYQLNHQGWIACVKFLSFPQLRECSDGKIRVQTEQDTALVNDNKSKNIALYRQIQQQCAYQMMALRNTSDWQMAIKYQNQKLFIFLNDSQSLYGTKELVEEKKRSNYDSLVKSEFEIEANDKKKGKQYKIALNNAIPVIIKKEKLTESLREGIAVKTYNTQLSHGKISEASSKDRTVENNFPGRVDKLKTGSNGEICEMTEGSNAGISKVKTDPEEPITKRDNKSIVEINKVVTRRLHVQSTKVKHDNKFYKNKINTGSAGDSNIMESGSDDDGNGLNTGSGGDSNIVRTGTIDDSNIRKTGSAGDTNIVETGSTSDGKDLKTGSTSDDNEIKTSSTCNSKQLKTNLTSHDNIMDTGSTHCGKEHDNIMDTGSTHCGKELNTGTSHNSNKTKTRSSIRTTDVDFEVLTLKSGLGVKISKTKSVSNVRCKEFNIDYLLINTDLNADINKVDKISDADNIGVNTGSAEFSQVETVSNINMMNKVNSNDDDEISKGATDPGIESLAVRRDSVITMKRTRSSSAANCKKTKTVAVGSSERKAGSTACSNKVNSSSSVGINKEKTISTEVAETSVSPAIVAEETNSSVKVNKKKLDSSVSVNKRKIDLRVNVRKAKVDSPTTVNKKKVDSSVSISEMKDDSPAKSSKRKNDSPVRVNKRKVDSPVNKRKVDSPVNKRKVDSSVSKRKIDSSVSISKKSDSGTNSNKGESVSPKKPAADKHLHKTHTSNDVPAKAKKTQAACHDNTPDKKEVLLRSDSSCGKNDEKFYDIFQKKDLPTANISCWKTSMPKSDSLIRYFTYSVSCNKNKMFINVNNPATKPLSTNSTTSEMTLSPNKDSSFKKTGSNTKMSHNKTLFSDLSPSSDKASSKTNPSVNSLQSIISKESFISKKEKADTTSTLLNDSSMIHQEVSTSNKGPVDVRNPRVKVKCSTNCKFCDFESLIPFKLIKHMASNHKTYKDHLTDEEMKVIKNAIVKNASNEYVCPFCKYCCVILSDCKMHIYHKHLNLRTLKCNHCMFITRLPLQLKRHSTLHPK